MVIGNAKIDIDDFGKIVSRTVNCTSFLACEKKKFIKKEYKDYTSSGGTLCKTEFNKMCKRIKESVETHCHQCKDIS